MSYQAPLRVKLETAAWDLWKGCPLQQWQSDQWDLSKIQNWHELWDGHIPLRKNKTLFIWGATMNRHLSFFKDLWGVVCAMIREKDKQRHDQRHDLPTACGVLCECSPRYLPINWDETSAMIHRDGSMGQIWILLVLCTPVLIISFLKTVRYSHP